MKIPYSHQSHYGQTKLDEVNKMNEETKNENVQEEQVSNEKQQNQNEENIDLDMNEFGDLDISSGGGKPVFEKITKATVLTAELKTTPDRKTETKDGKTQSYYPVFLKVSYSAEIDGELKETYENYGGGRLFVSETDNSKRFWLGETSALGKLKKELEDNFDFKGTLKEIPELMKGATVGLKTETTNVAGKEYKKNMVEVFYK